MSKVAASPCSPTHRPGRYVLRDKPPRAPIPEADQRLCKAAAAPVLAPSTKPDRIHRVNRVNGTCYFHQPVGKQGYIKPGNSGTASSKPSRSVKLPIPVEKGWRSIRLRTETAASRAVREDHTAVSAFRKKEIASQPAICRPGFPLVPSSSRIALQRVRRNRWLRSSTPNAR